MAWKGISKDILDWNAFVYLIINKENGMKYIGQKSIKKKVTRKPLKGYKRKRIFYPESDWKTYYGSSESLKRDVEYYGEESFDRYILIYCNSKWDKNYYEAKLQIDNEVLKDDMFYNGTIQTRMNFQPKISKIKKTRYLKLLTFHKENIC